MELVRLEHVTYFALRKTESSCICGWLCSSKRNEQLHHVKLGSYSTSVVVGGIISDETL